MAKRLTQEEFIEKAKLKHVDKYDYSMVEYVSSKDKVIIICKEHGKFVQIPSDHLNGTGCKVCSNIKRSLLQRKNVDLLIYEFRLIHGNRYDYSRVNYKSCDSKIIIICREHGEFEKTPRHHSIGQGCTICNIKKKMDNNSFIEKSIKVHNNKYNYTKVNYINNHTKIIIICKEHGDFLQIPNSHLSNHGCPKCNSSMKMNNINFIKKAVKKHGFKYDYSLVKYISSNLKISIICKEHGSFEQRPYSHLNGQGCYSCSPTMKMSNNTFIKRSIEVHGDIYDYSNVNYISMKLKINIICKKHGIFTQNPFVHLQGSGCKKCTKIYSKVENRWLDSLGIFNRQFRIGKYIVDGYDPETNTIYEFNGDYWHGNPSKYNLNDININAKKLFSELYQKTLEKEEKLKSLGYNVISIWESDFLKEEKSFINI